MQRLCGEITVTSVKIGGDVQLQIAPLTHQPPRREIPEGLGVVVRYLSRCWRYGCKVFYPKFVDVVDTGLVIKPRTN